jgi:hypothetical protein
VLIASVGAALREGSTMAWGMRDRRSDLVRKMLTEANRFDCSQWHCIP